MRDKNTALDMLCTCSVPVTLLWVCVCVVFGLFGQQPCKGMYQHVVNMHIPTFLTARARKGTQELFDQNSSKYYN